MTEKISKRDWEMISAYLDGQLSLRKQSRFEARLQQEPRLQQAFEEIRKTRQILRNIPSLRAPRNFLLTPQIVGEQQRVPLLSPLFGWASAVASFLLVLVLIGDIFSAGGAIPVVFDAISTQIEQTASSQYEVAQDNVADVAAPTELAAMEGEAVGVYSEHTPAELPEDEPLPEVAIAPEMEDVAEAAPVELTVTQEPEPTPTKDIEIIVSGSPTDEITQSPEIPSEAVPAGENNGVVFMPPSETVEMEVTESIAGAQTLDEAVTLAFTPTTTATQFAESEVEQPTEVAQWEEATPAPAERAIIVSEPPVFEQEPALEMKAQVAESTFEEPQVEEKAKDVLLGAEVILAMLAAGLGIAWLFMRHRGG